MLKWVSNLRNPDPLRMLSGICEVTPLVLNEALSDYLVHIADYFFEKVFCSPTSSRFKTERNKELFFKLMESEFLSCCVSDRSPAVSARIAFHLSSFMESQRMNPTDIQTKHPKQEMLFRILEIATKFEDRIERIVMFSQLVLDAGRRKLPSAFISSISCFLCKSPELIPRFFTDTSTLNLFHNFISRHDRPHMFFTIMPSLTPQLVDILLNNEDLHDLLCLDSTSVYSSDLVSIFIQVVAINPSPLKSIPLRNVSRLHRLPLQALQSARVTSQDPANPHRLSFGRHTTNWTRFVEAASSVEWDEPKRKEKMIINGWITLLVVLAAGEDVDLSTAAVTLFQRECGLNPKQAHALLFSTPPSIPLNTDWPFPISDALTLSGSLCAAIGSIIPQPFKLEKDHYKVSPLMQQVAVFIMSCFVPILHTKHPSISSRFPFFPAELRTETTQSLWSIPPDSSTPHPLISLSEQISLSAGHFNYLDDYKFKMPMSVYHRLILTDVHTIPFVSDKVKCLLIARIGKTLSISRWLPSASWWHVLNVVMDITLIHSIRTHRSVIDATHEIVSEFRLNGPTSSEYYELVQKSEETIRAKMAKAEGEEKWAWYLHLWAMRQLSDEERCHFFLLAETDDQLDLTLPGVIFSSFVGGNNTVWAEEKSANRLIEVAGRSLESDLSMRAWSVIGKDLHPRTWPEGRQLDEKMMTTNKKMIALILQTLTVAVQTNDGKREGSLFSFSNNAAFVIETSVDLLWWYLLKSTFDLAPFIHLLASLCRTGRLRLLNILLPVYEAIEKLTQNTSSPFSIHSYSIPYSPNEYHPTEPHTLIHIISSILLSYSISKDDPIHSLDDFDNPTKLTRMEVGRKMIELAGEMVESASIHPSPTQLPKHFIRFETIDCRGYWTPPRMWAALIPFWRKNEQISLIRTHVLQFGAPLARLARATLRFTDDRFSNDYYENRRWEHAFSVFKKILVLLKSLDPTQLDTNPALSSLLSSLAILLIRRDFSLSPLVSVFDALFPNFRRADLPGSDPMPFRPNLERFLYAFREEGLDDRRLVHRCVAFWVLWIGLLGVDWVWRDGIDIVRPCLDLDWCGGDQAVARDHREEELGVRVGRGEETVGDEAHGCRSVLLLNLKRMKKKKKDEKREEETLVASSQSTHLFPVACLSQPSPCSFCELHVRHCEHKLGHSCVGLDGG
ncbi:hypothetical protein BLNAU_14991 [Blattamonas nauphoetae]|uniref:Uncharacterized protein n=1 Tax=Blattamonas nauphoetae TaxID=2049346 RepID=A0ABQ9XF75_9EUKA|nr:hypothetical protein BLNAU_14991 [Blattamonas nauphoetae]